MGYILVDAAVEYWTMTGQQPSHVMAAPTNNNLLTNSIKLLE